MNDQEFAAACWDAGVRPEWYEGKFKHRLNPWKRPYDDEQYWHIEFADTHDLWSSLGDIITDHEAACLMRCKMLDELAQPLDELRFRPAEVLDMLIDRAALLAAWRAVGKEKE